MGRRTSTRQSSRDARAAIAAARQADDFQDDPDKQGGGGNDLYDRLEDLFAQDDARDDQDDVPELTEPDSVDVEAIEVPGGQEVSVQRNGRVVLRDARTKRIKSVVQDPPRIKGRGTFASAADEQAARLGGTYDERVAKRVDAIAKSLFGGGPGAVTPARRQAVLDAYKADRKRRGWRVPDL